MTFASADESTVDASISSPLSSTTPVARVVPWPVDVRILATGASVRISAPSAWAARAIAYDTPPVPPLGMPQARKAPSISPM